MAESSRKRPPMSCIKASASSSMARDCRYCNLVFGPAPRSHVATMARHNCHPRVLAGCREVVYDLIDRVGVSESHFVKIPRILAKPPTQTTHADVHPQVDSLPPRQLAVESSRFRSVAVGWGFWSLSVRNHTRERQTRIASGVRGRYCQRKQFVQQISKEQADGTRRFPRRGS